MSSDQLQRFLFDHTQVRGEIAQLEQTYKDVLDNHGYPPVIERLLGELLAACALLTATIKLDGTLSVEIRGQGAVTLLMAESNPGMGDKAQRLRGIARYDDSALDELDDTALASLIGDGRLIITLDPREGQRYQGIVAMDRPDIAGCLEGYFAQSEQLPTRLWLAADSQYAAGLLIQKLPQDSHSGDIDDDAWDRINHLADTITADELTGLDAEAVLFRLFNEEDARLFDPSPVVFECTCSRARFGSALHQLGADELRSVIEEQGQIETQCHFCNTYYVFTAADTEALIADPDAASPTVH